ncbi:MAG: DNA-binding domain-containing protein [Beijerinckiaceae bacterium]|nr:DNA-binding domain-containing protein [Beijerinckiaceae bacterium]
MPDTAAFAKALRDPHALAPSDLRARDGADVAARFAVYRNNVVVGLVEATRQNFPVTEAIVGEDFFAAMARVYIAAAPPASPVISTYGDDFATFLQGFEHVADMPYLADVARLESARRRAYHAADAQPCDPAVFAALPPHCLGGLRVALHPSCRLVRSAHPVVTIWRMNAGEMELGSIESWTGEDALVHRLDDEVRVALLPPGGAAFLQALLAGDNLQDAAAQAFSDASDFDLSASLASLFQAQAITGFTLQDEDHAHD